MDHSSASDLIGLALNPPAFPRPSSDEAEATSQTFTITPYTLLAAFNGFRPLDPLFYQENTDWRQISLTLGFEEEETAGDDVAAERAIVAGAKVTIWNPRDIPSNDADVEALRGQLETAGTLYGEIENFIQDLLFEEVGKKISPGINKVDFINDYLSQGDFETYLNFLDERQRQEIRKRIEDRIEPFLLLKKQAESILDNLRKEPQVSLSAQAKAREIDPDEFKFSTTLDYGLDRLDWTLNGSFEYRGETDIQKEQFGGSIATEFALRVSPESLTGSQPMTFSVAGKGMLLEDTDVILQVQAKLVIPIANGLNLPFSVTWANRSELIEEEEIRGRIGFSLDTSRLLSALQ